MKDIKSQYIIWNDVKCWMRVSDSSIELREFGTDKPISFNQNELMEALKINQVQNFTSYKK